MSDTRPCAVCGEPIPHVTASGQPLAPSQYAGRTVCSARCRAARSNAARHHEAMETVAEIEARLAHDCEHCGQPIRVNCYRRGGHETAQMFVARRYCNRACAAASRRPEPRMCQRCGGEIPYERPGKRQSPGEYRRRTFCSIACARYSESMAAVGDAPRHCAHCGNQLVRAVRANGEPESPYQFARRQTCGRDCAKALSQAARPTPTCRHCGKVIEKCNGQTHEQLARRKFCSRDCFQAHCAEHRLQLAVDQATVLKLAAAQAERLLPPETPDRSRLLTIALRGLREEWRRMQQGSKTGGAAAEKGARMAQRVIVRFVRELSGRTDLADAAAAWKWLTDAVREADADVASNLPPVRRDVLTACREGARTGKEMAERTGYSVAQCTTARHWLVTAGLLAQPRREREAVS